MSHMFEELRLLTCVTLLGYLILLLLIVINGGGNAPGSSQVHNVPQTLGIPTTRCGRAPASLASRSSTLRSGPSPLAPHPPPRSPPQPTRVRPPTALGSSTLNVFILFGEPLACDHHLATSDSDQSSVDHTPATGNPRQMASSSPQDAVSWEL